MTSTTPPFFSPVAPIQILEELFEQSPLLFGHYHLLLAHHTVVHPDRFQALFKRASKFWRNQMGMEMTVIMDNSLVECGGAVDRKMVMEAANIIKEVGGPEGCPEVIAVLPDAMGDGITTRVLIQGEFEAWHAAAEESGLELMAVVQGADFADFEKSLVEFSILPISWLGIPRILVKTCGSRITATAKAVMESPQYIHLLGFSDNPPDDFACRVQGVIGIDSAVPIRIGDQFSLATPIAPRDPEWFENGRLTPQNLANVQAARLIFESGLPAIKAAPAANLPYPIPSQNPGR